MKRIFSVFLLLACITTFLFRNNTKKTYAEGFELNVTSEAACLINYDSGDLVYSKNETKRLPIASITKVMTLLICFEEIENGNINLNDEIIVSNNASSMGGSQVFLEENGVYLASDLIKSIIVASANDSCVAMAERISGSEQLFVDKMNKKAEELGLLNTNFANCTGLPKEGQYSCAIDVAKMFSKLIRFDNYFNYSTIWMDKITHSSNRVTEISNTNKLIRFYNGCDGGKTGYTSEAGHCLVATSIKNNMRMISVVLKAKDSKTRFAETSNMFNYSFNNFELRKIIDKNKALNYYSEVKFGTENLVNCLAEEDFYAFTKKNQTLSYDYEANLFKLNAPITKGQKVGELTIFENGVNVKTINLLSVTDVKKLNFGDSINKIANDWALIG